MAGYIKIHRKLLSWGWYSVPCVKDVFLHLLITANYAQSEYRGVTIERGQAVFGLVSLSETLGYSVQQIRTAIRKLKQTGEIKVWSNNHFSIATITNYHEYQEIDEQQTDNNQITNNQQSNNNQITTSKEEKEEKEIKKSTYTSVMDEFNSICRSLPKIKAINAARRVRIERVASILHWHNTNFKELFMRVEASDFLTGKVKDWRADFDWILKPEHLTKIMEGNYDNPKPRSGVYSTEGASFDVRKYDEGGGLFDD